MDTIYWRRFEIRIETINNQLTSVEEKEIFDYIKSRIEGRNDEWSERLFLRWC